MSTKPATDALSIMREFGIKTGDIVRYGDKIVAILQLSQDSTIFVTLEGKLMVIGGAPVYRDSSGVTHSAVKLLFRTPTTHVPKCLVMPPYFKSEDKKKFSRRTNRFQKLLGQLISPSNCFSNEFGEFWSFIAIEKLRAKVLSELEHKS